MSEAHPIYVLAVLGTSPAILTELLWWLVAREEAEVVGVEVWTTYQRFSSRRTGAGALAHALFPEPPADSEVGLWDQLTDALGARSDRVPSPPPTAADLRPRSPSELGDEPVDGFELVVFQREGRDLPDVRDPGDAEAVTLALHDRVRGLRRSLPEGVVLLGSLAGGRKTMSSSLQTAFCLQARRIDRLVHVLVDPRLELTDHPSGRGKWIHHLAVPSAEAREATGVSEEDQVAVYDVPFPLLRPELRPASRDLVDGDGLAHHLATSRALNRSEVTARLVPRPEGGADLVFYEADGTRFDSVRLKQLDAAQYAVLAQAEEPLDDVKLAERVVGGPSWGFDNDAQAEAQPDSLRVRHHRLLKALGSLPAKGLDDFRPISVGKAPTLRILPAATRVLVGDPSDLDALLDGGTPTGA